MTMKTIDPIEATYRHYEYNYADGSLTPQYATVTIVGESLKSLYVKCHTFIRGHRPGDIIRVARKSITTDVAKKEPDYSQAWWNK